MADILARRIINVHHLGISFYDTELTSIIHMGRFLPSALKLGK